MDHRDHKVQASEIRTKPRRIPLLAVVCGVVLAMHPATWAGPDELVRIGYVIPSNWTEPESLSRPGLTIARRSLCIHVQAVS